MSSDEDDEFEARYDPTTPVAGPSKPTAPGGAAKRRTAVKRVVQKADVMEIADDQDVVLVSSSENERKQKRDEHEDDGDPVEILDPTKVAGKKVASNGKSRSAKGRTKAVSPPKPPAEEELMDVDHDQVVEVTSQKNNLAQQLQELHQIRETEPEQVLRERSADFDAKTETQTSLIKELTSQLARVKELSGSEKSYTLHFLTREAADEENKAMKTEVDRLKETIRRKDMLLAEKDKLIAQQKDREKVLQSDLQAEIERGKLLSSRNPPPAVTRVLKNVAEDPLQHRIIRLYEDMTNMLITGVKLEKNAMTDIEEPIFTCIYTCSGTGDAPPFSLNFTLRQVYDRPDDLAPNITVASKDQLEEKFRYTPLNLDKELPEFVQRLSFFKDPFAFSYGQMTIFLKTLTDTMAGVQGNGEEEDEMAEDEAVMVEKR
ncbi:hypothetical protein A0H81_10976 [Grifola frondosa]|uniref:Monopolin complex subunit Csm1/Pcs1 C-terminal domain-containing protein n=1 Tax=Grifola frondosa TaxID=5627 RepID=A0A1C7LWV3_GRIFR|nr:hypothetical protein A0H81_10976 [Grifola frondosa]